MKIELREVDERLSAMPTTMDGLDDAQRAARGARMGTNGMTRQTHPTRQATEKSASFSLGVRVGRVGCVGSALTFPWSPPQVPTA